MSTSTNKFPSGLWVFITVVILAVLIWLLAFNTIYFYYCIGAAVLITALVIYLVYRKPSTTKKAARKVKAASDHVGDEKTSAAEAEDVIQAESPPIPLIDDESALTDEEKNILVNAVWYRCENPYCKYTSFLSVHHILEEKDGGDNKLDNLIVLCPFCHDLAHRGEIPEKEMREWNNDRAERWKFKPEWKYL
jgi:hypothetical protein